MSAASAGLIPAADELRLQRRGGGGSLGRAGGNHGSLDGGGRLDDGLEQRLGGRGGGRRELGGLVGRLRAVEAGGRGGDGSGGRLVFDLAGGGLQHAVGGAGERVGERGGLLHERLDARRGQALGGRAVGAQLQRLLVRERRPCVDLHVGALEEAGHAAREALAAADHDGVGAELGAHLREHVVEAAAAEGLGISSRIHVQSVLRH